MGAEVELVTEDTNDVGFSLRRAPAATAEVGKLPSRFSMALFASPRGDIKEIPPIDVGTLAPNKGLPRPPLAPPEPVEVEDATLGGLGFIDDVDGAEGTLPWPPPAALLAKLSADENISSESNESHWSHAGRNIKKNW